MSKIKTIAFDLGGVIFSDSNDTNIFSNDYLNTPINLGIYELLENLSKHKNYKLIVISKAFPNNARKSKELLKHYDLEKYFNSIIFCEDIAQKAEIAMAMKVKIMIDDREDVLAYFPETIKTIHFYPQCISSLYNQMTSYLVK